MGVFISVFWCHANADNQEDEEGNDKGKVHLHFYMKSDGGPEDYASSWNDPCASVICQATNKNTNGFPHSIFNRFFRRPESNGDKTVSGCCSNNMNVVGR